MWKNPALLLLIATYSILFNGCARPGSLSGGPVDETPPVLNIEESAPNMQTNFNQRTFDLTFDEWLKLENTYKEVVISPPLVHNPEIKLRGKTVRFSFHEDEVLRDEATYTINFGQSVKDLNAGNIVEDLRFVFSTGDFIDSLEINGKVLDVETGSGVENVLLMLYDNLSDTVVRTERPFYFARTDKSGAFKIQNIKSDTFKVVALIDENFNYFFDGENEKIGFLDQPIVLPDSSKTPINVTLFQEEIPLRLIKKDSSQHGLLKLIFNRTPRNVELNFDSIGQQVVYEYEQDSILVWNDQVAGNDWPLYIQIDTLLDTVMILNHKRASFLEKAKLKLTTTFAKSLVDLNPAKPIRLAYNHPLQSWDTTLIRCYEDSLKTLVPLDVKIDSTAQKELEIQYNWKEKVNYELMILPNAITDIYGLKNQDTLLQSYNILERSAFGNINLKIEKIPPGQYYVLQLLFKNDNLVEEFAIGGDSIFQKTFNALPPGTYSLRIIEDRNNNQRWDTGNYDRKEQPERRATSPIEELRAGWDVETTIPLEFKGSEK